MQRLNKKCRKCRRLIISRSRITWGFGNELSEVMFVGEAPGLRGCDKTGIPFDACSSSGKFFQECLGHIGLRLRDVYVTNAVKCMPPRNKRPSMRELNNCFKYLQHEIRHVNPKLVVCLGSAAAQRVLKWPVNVVKDATHIYTRDFRYVMAIPHPSYAKRFAKFVPKYDMLFRKIKKLSGIKDSRCLEAKSFKT